MPFRPCAPGRRRPSIACTAGEENLSHSGVLSNFTDAVQGKAALLTDAREGLKSVELANAMVYSAWENSPVHLPLDSAKYESALMEKSHSR